MDDNILRGPWPEREPQRPRRPLPHLAILAGGLRGLGASVVVERKPVDPSLLQALGAKLECSAALARSLADECKSLQRVADAAALETIASVMEDRAAGIALDLGLFEE